MVELCDSINIQQDPELREALMANQINAVTCEHCGFHFRVDKQLLYHDPSRAYMIFCLPADDTALQAATDQFHATMQGMQELFPDELEAPDVHLVHSRVELIERIFVLEAGLDERIVEYVKYTLYTQNLQRLPPDRTLLLFDAQDSDDTHLVFVAQDLVSSKFELLMKYERIAYEVLCETFDEDDQTGGLLELFPGPHISARRLLLEESLPTPEAD